MPVDTLRQALPPYAKDISANLAMVADEMDLTEQQKWGCLIASAYAVGSAAVIAELEDGCPLTDDALNSAKAAAAVMAMNNVYYRTISQMKSRDYANLPAGLRMSAIGDPGVDRLDFELWCMAVSAINGCGVCLDAHEAELRKHGVPSETIQAAFRVAAVVNAASRVLIAESGKDKAAESSRAG